MAKKKTKNVKSAECKCGCHGHGCAFLLGAAIIALLWIWPTVTWSKITITVLAALIALTPLKKCNC